ncbi:MAG: hypothetical protein R3D84_16570 [Paracoccaceae bacterium]
MRCTMRNPATQSYSPLYFLASLGAGGLVVTFFMWLYFWVPHPDQPVPVFEDIARALTTAGLLKTATIYGALAGIALFAVLNLKALLWNLRELARFRKTAAYETLRNSNAETQLAAMPLALAMSVNMGFILGMVFVPGLWSVVEYLFPLALAVFLLIGVATLRLLGRFLGRALGKGGFDCAANTSFAQVLPAFALAMAGVGMSAPAALSANATTAGIALILASFFLVAATLWAAIAMVLGLRAMLEHGANAETAPTLLIGIPLITVLGILVMRLNHGLHVHFGGHGTPADTLMLTTRLVAAQVAFALFGLAVLARQGYAARFIFGRETSVGSYALVCPGVAMSVMLHFWINKGLVGAGIIAKYGVAYWGLSGVAIALQLAMIALVFVLNRRHFRTAPAGAVPAE